MGFTVKNADGVGIAGDEIVDDRMRRAADEAGGWIEDDDGVQVYTSQQ